ncbi:MAG: hypothetical protein NZ518_06640 [Dehalococcoidia bacterium]|nr:hypothetical protein [Dehalococcoidia bacterium]
MSFGETILARLSEAAAAGQDGITVFFPEEPEVHIPRWAMRCAQEPAVELARRVVPADPDWRLSELSA